MSLHPAPLCPKMSLHPAPLNRPVPPVDPGSGTITDQRPGHCCHIILLTAPCLTITACASTNSCPLLNCCCRPTLWFNHTQAQCALQAVQQPLRQDSTTRSVDSRVSQAICLSWNGGQCACPAQGDICAHLVAAPTTEPGSVRTHHPTPVSEDGLQGHHDHHHIHLLRPPVVDPLGSRGPVEFFII